MTELAKSAMSFFSKCDLDLTSIYEVIWQGSSKISMDLYAEFIWLDTVKISSKSDVRLPRYCKFSSGVFFYPPPLGSLRVAKTLYLWVLTTDSTSWKSEKNVTTTRSVGPPHTKDDDAHDHDHDSRDRDVSTTTKRSQSTTTEHRVNPTTTKHSQSTTTTHHINPTTIKSTQSTSAAHHINQTTTKHSQSTSTTHHINPTTAKHSQSTSTTHHINPTTTKHSQSTSTTQHISSTTKLKQPTSTIQRTNSPTTTSTPTLTDPDQSEVECYVCKGEVDYCMDYAEDESCPTVSDTVIIGITSLFWSIGR